MTHHLDAFAERLLTNHFTIRFPRIDVTPERPRALPHRLLVKLHVSALRMALVRAGYHRFLDHIDRDPAGGWCIHLFLADQDAARLVPGITQGMVEPGDPASFDAKAFVEWRLQSLEYNHRLTPEDPWWKGSLS